MSKYISNLGESINNFLELKHSLGFVYHSAQYYLSDFDKFNFNNGNYSYINKETLEKWLIIRIERCKSPDRSFIPYIREYSRYMFNLDGTSYIVDEKFKTKHYHADVYLMSEEEIYLFFSKLKEYCENSNFLSIKLVLQPLFIFLYHCGVRCKEARILKCEDVDLDKGYIDIKNTKNRSDRRLYITVELVKLFKEYDDEISKKIFNRKYFFSTHENNYVSSSFISVNFKKVWKLAGLKTDVCPSPRAYDFRHHFACANILKWMNEGKDVHAMLPYLMTYMGHASIESTYYYIHLIPEFFNKYNEISSISDELVPEVEDYEV